MAEPIDTSRLGAIKIDPNDRSVRARVVKEALEVLAQHEPDDNVARALLIVARNADNETLLRLARLLKG